jgi:hypothetical protein
MNVSNKSSNNIPLKDYARNLGAIEISKIRKPGGEKIVQVKHKDESYFTLPVTPDSYDLWLADMMVTIDEEGKEIVTSKELINHGSSNFNKEAKKEKSKPEILKTQLIELYAEHPEISEKQFRHLFDRLFELSEKTSLGEEEEEELEAIETEINSLI